jgi:hypothetical protein
LCGILGRISIDNIDCFHMAPNNDLERRAPILV